MHVEARELRLNTSSAPGLHWTATLMATSSCRRRAHQEGPLQRLFAPNEKHSWTGRSASPLHVECLPCRTQPTFSMRFQERPLRLPTTMSLPPPATWSPRKAVLPPMASSSARLGQLGFSASSSYRPLRTVQDGSTPIEEGAQQPKPLGKGYQSRE